MQSVITDDRFKIPSCNAKKVVRAGETLLEWALDHGHRAQVGKFCEDLQTQLQVCLLNSKQERERMWASYHSTRVSAEFEAFWVNFLELVGIEPLPLFYQHLTDHIFQEMISVSCAMSMNDSPETETDSSLTYEECNALRYIAGYVCAKTEKKIKSKTHSFRDDMLLCFMDIKDEEMDASNSADWVHAVDRGGLYKVSESTFMVFHGLECKVRQILNFRSAEEFVSSSLQEKIHKSVMTDDKVLLHWSMVAVEIEEEPATILLSELAKLYVTIRGYSFAKTVVEQYKQALKKPTQKSKALRKNIPK